jgi:hypothetical protein
MSRTVVKAARGYTSFHGSTGSVGSTGKMAKARSPSRMADRSSSAVSRWLKLARRSFQARSPAVMTETAAGVNRWPSPQAMPVIGHDRQRCRGGQLDALTGPDRRPVDHQDEDRGSCNGREREGGAEQRAECAKQRDEGEGPQPRFLPPPLPLQADEQAYAESEHDPRQRLECRPAADVHRLGAPPGGSPLEGAFWGENWPASDESLRASDIR